MKYIPYSVNFSNLVTKTYDNKHLTAKALKSTCKDQQNITLAHQINASDGIGRHDGFKIRCLNGRVGSSPTTGTTIVEESIKEPQPSD